MAHAKDMTGQRRGRLVVVERAGTDKSRCVLWKCKCDCGNEVVVRGTDIRAEKIQSCGCYSTENTRLRTLTHGKTRTRLYRIWAGMKQRCTNPKEDRYHRYGGRGITICDDWLDFQNFHNWAMTNGYRDDLTIDRINNDGNYEPSNCRWTTIKEQSNNKSTNVFIEYNGERKTIKQWEEQTGIPSNRIWWRLHEGWTIEETLTTPARKKRQ